MENNLQHEDLLIKLRAKLNEEKIKLWQEPYLVPENEISPTLQNLAKKYSTELSTDHEVILQALRELQTHSVDRSKANEEFKETGLATFRVKVTMTGQKPKMLRIQKKLDEMGSELITIVAREVGVVESRVKLIVNGKVIKPTPSLEEQGVKNGVQIMALIMAETPEEVKKEDNMYMEMKAVRDDATLLSEYVDKLADDDEYMKLEDQSGKTVELPPTEKRSLLVGLALHERGRAAAKHHDYPLALVLLLEADKQLSECSSSILKSVDNWALLQLDISWCYLCLQSLPSATDAAQRLVKAEAAFKQSYGENHERLIALKGNAANERVLLMRMYLLQGIVAYHQNKRSEAKALLDKAEIELNSLRVDENDVSTLMELGWSRSQARSGLRATAGDPHRAHDLLDSTRKQRDRARDHHRTNRQQRLLGTCIDGTQVNQQLVEALMGMGYTRRLAASALKNSNNHVAEAVRIIQEQPELLEDSDMSSDEASSPDSQESLVEPDNKLIAELESMGYCVEEVKKALSICSNHINRAIDLLMAGTLAQAEDQQNPSTSTGTAAKRKQQKHKNDKRRKEREQALHRLTSAIRHEEDDYLDTSLVEEEEFLAQYKSLL